MLYRVRINSPIIDVLLLTHNNLSYTKKCIEKLYKHTSNFGLIILDNHSTDGTVEYLTGLSNQNENITLYLSNKNSGIIKGRNFCYELSQEPYSQAKYICFIDNDQYVIENWLESYLEFFEKGFDIVGKEAWRMRQSDLYPVGKVNNPDDFFHYVGCGGMMIRKEVIDKIGLFDKIFSPCYFEDPDYCWTASENGYKIGWNYNPVIVHDHKGPLLNHITRQYFLNSWKKINEKWGNKKIPVFKNNLKSENS